MTSDASAQPSVPAVPSGAPETIDRDQPVRLKSESGRLILTLPPEGESDDANANLILSWTDIWQQLKHRLNAGERFWQPNTTVHLIARDRLLDVRQLQTIAEALSEVQLQLKRVYTSRRQTAVAAATAGYSVEQQSPVALLNPSTEGPQAMAEPLYLETTLRSGSDVRHNGTVVILGDLNPGSSVVAEGDILVWGHLRGVVHAGSKGNSRALIMALHLEPTLLRIADFVARAPETPPPQYDPEVAYVSKEGAIRIARAIDFRRDQIIGGQE